MAHLWAACSAGTPSSDDNPSGSSPTSGTDANQTPWAAFGGTRECWLTERETYDNYSYCRSGCFDAQLADPGFDCFGVCRDSWCFGCTPASTNSCYLHRYRFQGGEFLSDLKASCEAAVARDQRCGSAWINPDCNTAALIESRDMVSVYDCVANTPCDEDPLACGPASNGAALADKVCEEVSSSCKSSFCTADARRLLEAVEPWLRKEAIDVARACIQEASCRDLRDCMSAWVRAVAPGASIVLFE
jgi:hypothetical protein